jgi:hypothetical protein
MTAEIRTYDVTVSREPEGWHVVAYVPADTSETDGEPQGKQRVYDAHGSIMDLLDNLALALASQPTLR